MMTDEQLAEIEARANAATPGELLPGSGRSVMRFVGTRMRLHQNVLMTDEDVGFFYAARADIPKLLAEVRRLKDELRKEYENHAFNDHGW